MTKATASSATIRATIMKTAWNIARNAFSVHNSDVKRVAETGVARVSEFFREALKLAWKQLKTGNVIYKMRTVKKRMEVAAANVSLFLEEHPSFDWTSKCNLMAIQKIIVEAMTHSIRATKVVPIPICQTALF